MKDIEEFKEKILKNDYVYGTGLTSVINKDIKIELDEYGEYKPDLSKALENKNDVKPMLKVIPNSDSSTSEDIISKALYANIPNIKYDKKLGYYKDIFAGHVIEGDYRRKASSGGFGTWIFKELLERDLIDGVIHVKENKNKDEEILFHYDISSTIEEIQGGAKTKYYPVEMSKVINKILETPGRYAIIGIPSFIYSIRLLAEENSIIKERIKFTVGLICGHQKSSKFADSLAWQVGIEPGKLIAIDFRKKLPDLPANRYGVEITGIKNGEEVTIVKRMDELIGHGWGHGFFKSHASDFTDDVMNETADVTIGDAWLPEYVSDSKGNNVILVRDPRILSLLQEGINDKKIYLDKITKNSLIKSQASHYRHTVEELSYRLFKKDKAKVWRPKKRVEASSKIPFIRKKIQDLRLEIAQQSHIVFKEAVEKRDFEHFKSHMNKYTKKYDKLYRMKIILETKPTRLAKRLFKKLSKLRK